MASFKKANSKNAEVGTILNGVFRLFFLWCIVFSQTFRSPKAERSLNAFSWIFHHH
jgi:hypothetical protein